jgi:hypothetical protein
LGEEVQKQGRCPQIEKHFFLTNTLDKRFQSWNHAKHFGVPMGSAGKRYPLEPVSGKSGMTDHRNNGLIRKTGGTQMTADHRMPAHREGYAGSALPGIFDDASQAGFASRRRKG